MPRDLPAVRHGEVGDKTERCWSRMGTQSGAAGGKDLQLRVRARHAAIAEDDLCVNESPRDRTF